VADETANGEQWSRREHSVLDGLHIFALAQNGEAYSPDRTWLIIGEGASLRLLAFLNSLEAEAEQGRRWRELAGAIAQQLREAGHLLGRREGGCTRCAWLADYDAALAD
jgi:hypothetical protein